MSGRSRGASHAWQSFGSSLSEELPRAYKPYIETCIAAFGPDRGMFESNFPPDGVSSSYAVLWNAFNLWPPATRPTKRPSCSAARQIASTVSRRSRWRLLLLSDATAATTPGAKTAVKLPTSGDLGPFSGHGFLHRGARQHAFAVLHDARQLGRVDPIAFAGSSAVPAAVGSSFPRRPNSTAAPAGRASGRR
jgi:hypothetical protein